MANVGFRLVGFAEDENIESAIAAQAPRLPAKWLAPFNHYEFIYAHSQSSMQYKIKVTKESQKSVITGTANGQGERLSKSEFEITTKEYIFSGGLPIRIAVAEDGTEERSGLEEKLQTVFISTARIEDLASQFKVNIIQKLLPSLQKEGYEESAQSGVQDARDEREEELRARRGPQPPYHQPHAPEPARPYPFYDPLAARPDPRQPGPDGFIPGFDDELDMNRPLRDPFGRTGPSLGPFGGIGRDDLHPPGLGPHDPLRPSLGPFGGGGFPQGGNGGMHPDFNDPMFHGERPGYNPRAPPGARYDPTGFGGPNNPFI